MNSEDSKAFEKNSKIKEGLGGWYENCVNHKSKNDTKLSLGGHRVIKNEYGATFEKKSKIKKGFGR